MNQATLPVKVICCIRHAVNAKRRKYPEVGISIVKHLTSESNQKSEEYILYLYSEAFLLQFLINFDTKENDFITMSLKN